METPLRKVDEAYLASIDTRLRELSDQSEELKRQLEQLSRDLSLLKSRSIDVWEEVSDVLGHLDHLRTDRVRW